MNDYEENRLVSSQILLRSPFYTFSGIWNRGADRAVISSPQFLEALFLASPSLYNAWSQALLRGQDNVDTDLLRSVHKYFLRMSYRCTPFGLFSGLTWGTFSTSTQLSLGDFTKYRKHTRLDNHLLALYAQYLLEKDEVINSLKWYSNNTIYSVGDSIRYAEYRLDKSFKSFHLSSVRLSEHLCQILIRAKSGARISELQHSLECEEISGGEARNFILELIKCKLLISQLELNVTGLEPQSKLVEILSSYPDTIKYAEFLVSLTNAISEIDSKPPGVAVSKYRHVVEKISEIGIDCDENMIFQSDLIKPATAFTINNCILDDLRKSISFLTNFFPDYESHNLKQFKEAFYKRYELSEVPLLEALDQESGLGYPVGKITDDNSPLLYNAVISTPQQQPYGALTITDKIILEKYIASVQSGTNQIILTDDDLEKNELNLNRLPSSLATICNVLASSSEEIDKGNYQIVHGGTYGPSSTSLLGRFCHIDENIHEGVRQLIGQEEFNDPDRIYAEVVHLAQSRVGNVLARPAFRKFEIPIVTPSAVDSEHSIQLEDLMISIVDNRIVLRSKKYDKEVIPRNTTAHNYAKDSLPYYHFLSEIQFQSAQNKMNWKWGFLDNLPFLPRVSYGRVILSRAKWNIDLNRLGLNKPPSLQEFSVALGNYLKVTKVTNIVSLALGDNQIPLKLDQESSIGILFQELKRNERVVLEEELFNDHNLFVKDLHGGFTNEFIIPWTQTGRRNYGINKGHGFTNSVQRCFPPGGIWHYVKIYCGVKVADEVLVRVIKPVCQELLTTGKIFKWFFVRYGDPEHHLRVRFLGDGQHCELVTNRINHYVQEFLRLRLVWKIQIDTYQRELERYGADNIEQFESIAFNDSELTLEILDLLEGDEGDELRWQFATKGVINFLDAFQLDLSKKKEVVKLLGAPLLKEFGGDTKNGKKLLGSKYKEVRKGILNMINECKEEEFVVVWEEFEKHRNSIRFQIDKLRKSNGDDKQLKETANLLSNYIHMFINRFFRSKQRLHEMVIYDLLYQHFRSQEAQLTEAK